MEIDLDNINFGAMGIQVERDEDLMPKPKEEDKWSKDEDEDKLLTALAGGPPSKLLTSKSSIVGAEVDLDALAALRSKAHKPKPALKFSDQQLAIFEKFADKNSGHVTIIARAGSSKTTTSIEGGKHAPERSIVYAAFGNAIAKELSTKISDTRSKAQTIHSMGCGIIRQKRPDMDIDKNISYIKVERAITDYFDMPENRWDSTALNYLRENTWHPVKVLEYVKIIAPYASDVDEIWQTADDMNVSSTPIRDYNQDAAIIMKMRSLKNSERDEWQAPTFMDRICDIVLLVLNRQTDEAFYGKGKLTIDFNDMIWLPVRCGWVVPKYELVVIDEAQDLSYTQIELATLICKGRIFIVGDDKQAIYAWRGADSDSLSRMTKYLNSTTMYLTTCYRCAKSIVRHAQRYVEDIMPWEESPEGKVEYCNYDKMILGAKKGDFIICRSNQPLMSICLRLISKGKRALMAGNDIGKKMLKILEDVEGKGGKRRPFRSCEEMWQRLIEWGLEEKKAIEDSCRRKFTNMKEERLKAQIDSRFEVVKDMLGMINVMIKEYKDPVKVKGNIKKLFEKQELDGEQSSDRNNYILCTSVHKAKGLEAETTWVLRDYLRQSPQEEKNIAYVAVTRAKRNLYLVTDSIEDYEEQEDHGEVSRRWTGE